MKHVVLFLGLIIFFNSVQAQDTSPSVRISGIVINADSLDPVPFTSIRIKNTTRGTVSDNSGYFSIFAYELDTLVFSNVGYSESEFVVPPNLPMEIYGLVHALIPDTLVLGEVVIFPWPSPEDFEEAFLSLEVKPNPTTRAAKAKRGLQKALDTQLAREKFYYDQMRYNRLYNLTGFIRPNNFLNPITWSNFIRDWKSGVYQTDVEEIPDMD